MIDETCEALIDLVFTHRAMNDVGLHAPAPAMAARLGGNHGASRPQERQQRIVERLRVRHVQPVRRTVHRHQLAVQHSAVGALA